MGKFNQGYLTVESLASAIVDMELHMRPEGVSDLGAFEHDVLGRIGMPHEVAMRHRLPNFEHLFATESYSAGYYSYLWSDVMAADTWQAFLERAVLDKESPRDSAIHPGRGNATDRARRTGGSEGGTDVKALFEERGFRPNLIYTTAGISPGFPQLGGGRK